MGIWIPRAKPEEYKFTYAPRPRFITGLNYDFDLPGENSTVVPASYPKWCRRYNKQRLVCCLVCSGAMFFFYTRPRICKFRYLVTSKRNIHIIVS